MLLPHAYAFVDPLFSTGIAWGLRAIERVGADRSSRHAAHRVPNGEELARYDAMLARKPIRSTAWSRARTKRWRTSISSPRTR